eukprot:SAG22_NODE_21427_length_257_cov_0.651899_1_plen_24_part_10
MLQIRQRWQCLQKEPDRMFPPPRA